MRPFPALCLTLLGCAPSLTLPRLELGEPVLVEDFGLPGFQGFPDGHITVLRAEDGTCQTYWAEWESFRSLGCDPAAVTLDPGVAVISKGDPGGFDNGGAWLYSVARIDGPRLVGFFHAEDREWPGSDEAFVAWKSAAWATSDDDGRTWTKGERFLTSHLEKPSKPTWGGAGDFSVVRDEERGRWIAYYFGENGIKAAISEDPEGRPGTWLKYHRGEFSTPGIGGRSSVLPGLGSWNGGNPSVLWSDDLGSWLMVWHSWRGDLNIAISEDGIRWKAQRLLEHEPGQKTWYPTLVGHDSQTGGLDLRLFYGFWPDADDVGGRQLVVRSLRLDPAEGG